MRNVRQILSPLEHNLNFRLNLILRLGLKFKKAKNDGFGTVQEKDVEFQVGSVQEYLSTFFLNQIESIYDFHLVKSVPRWRHRAAEVRGKNLKDSATLSCFPRMIS